MGMCLALHSVSDRNIDKILETPPLIWRLIAQDDPAIYIEYTNNGKKGFFSRIFGNKTHSATKDVPNLEFIEGENNVDDLDKSWQGIHYCLNKTAYEAESPMDFITLGGKAAGDIEVGYGPARLFDSKTVKDIESRLSQMTIEQLRGNYNPDEMDKLDIYPKIWKMDGNEGFEYIAEYFEVLKQFVSNCSIHNLGMAVYLG